MAMVIQVAEVGAGAAVIHLAGRVMMGANNEALVQAVDRAVAAGWRTLVLDLAGVTHLDSTGIGHFIAVFNKLEAAGGHLRIAGATGHIFHTFHISRLDTVFPFFPTVDDALKG
jgi:anti-sigma B factor antagonist